MKKGERSRFGVRNSSFVRISGFGFRHFLVLTACAALAQEATPPDEDDVPEVEEEWDFTKGRGHDLTMLDKLVPAGQSHTGLRSPVYREFADGKASVLQSQFDIKLVTRLDGTHLQFKDTIVSIFGDTRYPDVATRMISLVEAYYDLQNDILFSSAPVQIMDGDQTIRSGSLLHDPVTGLTAFGHGVKLYPHESPPPSSGTPAPTPAPAPVQPPAPAAPPDPKEPQPPPPGP